jgi:hypothetical protein
LSFFVPLGVILAVVGIAMLAIAVRHHGEGQPKHAAMLIGGMMTTAFGIVIAGFAIAYQRAAPLDLNATSVPTP